MSARDRARERQERERAAQQQQGPVRAAPVQQAQPRSSGNATLSDLVTGNYGRRQQGPQLGNVGDVFTGILSGVLDAGAETVDGVGSLFDWKIDNAERAARGDIGAQIVQNAFQQNGMGAAFDSSAYHVRQALQRWNVIDDDGDVMPNAPRLVTPRDTIAGNFSDGISQFVAGFVAGGRVLGFTGKARGALDAAGRGFAAGGFADFFAFDGNEGRLSNLLRDYAGLRDPVTAYLAANENDNEAEGRIKSVLEGGGVGVLFETFMAGLRAMRGQRAFEAGRATESDLANNARAVQEASLSAAESARAQAVRDGQAVRRQRIIEETNQMIRVAEEEAFNGPLLPRLQEVEGRPGSLSAFDPTKLNPRQEQALQDLRARVAAIQEAGARTLRRVDLDDAIEAGDVPNAIRITEELGSGAFFNSGKRASLNPDGSMVSHQDGTVKGRVDGQEVDLPSNSYFPADQFRPVVSEGRLLLVPLNATERTLKAGARPLSAADNTVNIVPGAPISPEAMTAAARKQAARLSQNAEAATTPAEANAMRAEAERLQGLMDALTKAKGDDAAASEAATRLFAHLDDEATAALFPKRSGKEAINGEIGQTNAAALERARGLAAPQSVGVDEDFVRAVAERFAKTNDVASVVVRQRAEAWNDGILPARSADVNLAHVDTEDGVKAFVHSFVDIAEAQIRTVRGETAGHTAAGVRKDPQMQAIAQSLAKDIGTDPSSLLARVADMTGSTQHLDSKLQAMRMLHVSAADEAQRLMRAYLADHSEASLSRALVALQSFGSVHASLKGASSEIARALRTLQTTVSPDRSLIEQFSQIVDEGVVRALDPSGGSRTALDALQKVAGVVSHAPNRRGIARMFEPKWHRAVEDYYVASILSSPSTQVLNFIGNLATTIASPIEKMLGGVLTGNTVTIREAFDHAAGLLATAKESFRFASLAFREGRTFLDSTFEADYRSNFRAEAFGVNPDRFFGRSLNALGKVVGIVHRVMGAQDEFFKQLNYRSDLYASALREARGRGLRTPTALRTFVDEFVAAGFDGNGTSIRARIPPDQINLRSDAYDRALRLARRNTFSEDAGRIVGQVERGLRSIPFGRLVVPFYRTPVNILRYALRRTALSGSFWADAIGRNGPRAREQAIGMVSLGTVTYGSALVAAMNGGVTGAGPSDPNVRRALMETGWRPYSFKIGSSYVPYNRADPFGTFFGVVADAYERQNSFYEEAPTDLEDIALRTVTDTAQMLRDKTFFQGIDTVLNAIDNAAPEVEQQNIENFYGRLLGGFVPSIVARMDSDNFLRQPRSMLDAFATRTPFTDDGVEIRRNWLGEPANKPDPMLVHDWISPFSVSSADEDVALNEIARVAVVSRGGMTRLPRRIDGVDLTGFRSPVSGRNAYDRLQELLSTTEVRGKTLRQTLEDFISSDVYRDRMTDGAVDGLLEARGSRQTGLTAIRTRFLNQAKRELRAEIPELDAMLNDAAILRHNAPRQRGVSHPLPRGLEWLAPEATGVSPAGAE